MFCKNCGHNNKDGYTYCENCGTPLNNFTNIRKDNYYNSNNSKSSKNNNVLIICITVIILAAILAGTYLFLINGNSDVDLEVSTVSFYLDGNPGTGIPATIYVGKEYVGETMYVATTYSRDGSKLNNPTELESHIVDEDGNIIITEYAPIPKYPDYCFIEIEYEDQYYQYGCDMAKHKGSQTSVPKVIE